ncbi:hypothetical protein EV385_5305 [Krasilnikovia cinnamomea]|uniref:Uncharacterized protein n=1 Tax=Krasilnikovia cinnamomea TaxID=349313 RepID=A0A4Q7ZQI2_9ACTN|nr:hypothetical protein EV385_5305 [Krasilnikovia cinnamomea]
MDGSVPRATSPGATLRAGLDGNLHLGPSGPLPGDGRLLGVERAVAQQAYGQVGEAR